MMRLILMSALTDSDTLMLVSNNSTRAQGCPTVEVASARSLFRKTFQFLYAYFQQIVRIRGRSWRKEIDGDVKGALAIYTCTVAVCQGIAC